MPAATFARCGFCANRCRIRLLLDGDGNVEEARRAVGRRGGLVFEFCPNIARSEGLPLEQARELLRMS